MKRFALAALLCLFAALGVRAQVTVSGNLKEVGVANVTGSNTYVRFTLFGFGDSFPMVTGTNVVAVPYKDFKPDANGNISGSLQGNDTISVGSNPVGGTFYQVCIFYQGQKFRCAPYTINGTTFNLNSATPNSTSPTIPAPTGDNTYCRIDGGNCPKITTGDLITGNTPVVDVRSKGAKGDCVTNDTSAIQAAITAAATTSKAVLFPPIFPACYLISGTLVLPQGGNIRILAYGATIKRANATNVPMLENFNFANYGNFLSSTFVGPVTNATNGLALSWTSGNTVTVTWNNHGFVAGQSYFFLAGASPSMFNGVFAVLTVPDANHFTFRTERAPTVAPTGTLSAMKADQKIVIEGGAWNANRSGQTNSINNMLYNTIIIGGAQDVTVRNVTISDAGFYTINIGAARDALVENAEVTCTNDCAAVVGEGPLVNARWVNIHGVTTDDSVWIEGSTVGTYDPPWTSGDCNNILWDGINVTQTGPTTGEVTVWVPVPSVAYMGGLNIRNVSGNGWTSAVNIGSSATGSVLDDVRMENITTIGSSPSTGGIGINFSSANGTITINKADIKHITFPAQFPATGGNAIQVAPLSTINQLTVDGADIVNPNFTTALLYFAGTLGSVTISNSMFNAPGYILSSAASGASLTNVKLDGNNITGPTNGIINIQPAGTPMISMVNNRLNAGYGAVLVSSANVVASGNIVSGMTGGLVRAIGSITVNYDFFGNAFSGGSTNITTSGSPTITSTVCDIAGNCTHSGQVQAASVLIPNAGTVANGTATAPAVGIYGNGSASNGWYMDGTGALSGSVAATQIARLIAGFGVSVPGAIQPHTINMFSGSGTLISDATPTVTSGFMSGAIVANGTAAITLSIGGGAAGSTGVLGLPASTAGWVCYATNRSRFAIILQTGSTTTSATFTNYGGVSPFVATNWTGTDLLQISCFGY